MRIAWLTPVDARTPVARYSQEVVDALDAHAHVEVWAPTGRGAPAGSRLDVVFGDDDAVLDRLSGFDALVHNIGAEFRFHGGIYTVSRRFAGTVVLHDRSLSPLILALGRESPDGDGGHHESLEALYGPAAARIAAGGDAPPWATFSEAVLAGQTGAVVHSIAHAETVAGCWNGPLLELPFPAYRSWLLGPEREEPGSQRLTLVTSDPGTRVEAVLDVLAEDRELASRVHYVILGRGRPDQARLTSLAGLVDRYSLADVVEVRGSARTAQHVQAPARADVAIELHRPPSERAAATVAEHLAAGTALLVYATGPCEELPDDAVIKLDPLDRRALRAALWALVDDPQRRHRLAIAGRRLAEQRSIERYAAALAEFLADVPRWPWRPFNELIDRELASLGVGRDMNAYWRVGQQLSSILPAPRPSRPVDGRLVD